MYIIDWIPHGDSVKRSCEHFEWLKMAANTIVFQGEDWMQLSENRCEGEEYSGRMGRLVQVHCTLYIVQFSLYNLHSTLYNVCWTLYIIHCTL